MGCASKVSGINVVELSRRLKLSLSGISLSVKRGERISSHCVQFFFIFRDLIVGIMMEQANKKRKRAAHAFERSSIESRKIIFEGKKASMITMVKKETAAPVR